VFYTLNIAKPSEFSRYSNLFSDYAAYTAELALTLDNTIANYPKLRVGNALIVDFVEKSNAVDQALALNYHYAECADTSWGDSASDCAATTDLARDYKDSDISSACNSDVSLLTSCARSCGSCTTSMAGMPGSSCTADTDCNAAVYTDSGGSATCFTDTTVLDFTGDAAFCSAPFAVADCGTISSDTCSADETIDNSCDAFCLDDYQCEGGYCSSALGICLEVTTPAPTVEPASDECYCPRVVSELAAEFRDDISGFRPGNADGNYSFAFDSCSSPSECNSLLDENAYIKSLVGFVLVPFVLSILLFVMYCCCCMVWCGCQTCSKKRCCKCCLGDPKESLAARWIPTALMACVLVVIVWACVEGMVANGQMHDHIFAEDSDSVRTEVFGLYDVVINKFEGVSPNAEWVVDNVEGVINQVEGVVNGVASSIDSEITAIYGAFSEISGKYNDFVINTTLIEPFTQTSEVVSLPCDYCQDLSSQISDINDTFKTAVSAVDEMSSILNESSVLTSAKDTIESTLSDLDSEIDGFIELFQGYRTDTQDYMDQAESFDAYRSTYGPIFFLLPILWLVTWTLGVVFGVLGMCKMPGEWCFRCTWCPAMFLGAGVMLFFSFFAIFSVLWADLCWNLDGFEQDPVSSNLGVAMSSAGETEQVVSIVNACWTGGDLLEVFNLTSLLDELYGFRDNLTDSLNIDITNELSLDELDSFTTEIGLLNTDEFEKQGDDFLTQLNAVSGTWVKCECYDAVNDVCSGAFTRELLRNNECYNAAGADEASRIPSCWSDGTPSTTAEAEEQASQVAYCTGNFSQAFLAVNAEVDLINQTQSAIDDIKGVSSTIVTAYDNLFGVAVDVENSVENISCAVDPIWERLDVLRENYTNCGFLGEAYGGFKEIGCVTLFSDMYWISCAMMLIAFLSIAVVCLGFMTQYSWHPVADEDEEEPGSPAAMVKQVSSRFGLGLGPGTDDQVEMGHAMSGPGATDPSAPPESPGAFPGMTGVPDTSAGGDVL